MMFCTLPDFWVYLSVGSKLWWGPGSGRTVVLFIRHFQTPTKEGWIWIEICMWEGVEEGEGFQPEGFYLFFEVRGKVS